MAGLAGLYNMQRACTAQALLVQRQQNPLHTNPKLHPRLLLRLVFAWGTRQGGGALSKLCQTGVDHLKGNVKSRVLCPELHPGFGIHAGWVGIMMYSLSSGLPILFQGFLGPLVREMPSVMSFSDYVLRVRGPLWLVSCYMMVTILAQHQTDGHQFDSQPHLRNGVIRFLPLRDSLPPNWLQTYVTCMLCS